jgi:hypothetical protein
MSKNKENKQAKAQKMATLAPESYEGVLPLVPQRPAFPLATGRRWRGAGLGNDFAQLFTHLNGKGSEAKPQTSSRNLMHHRAIRAKLGDWQVGKRKLQGDQGIERQPMVGQHKDPRVVDLLGYSPKGAVAL